MTNSINGTIFDTLSRINCDGHVEKKQNLSYIAWTFAYKTLMEHYPDNTIEFTEEWLPNNTVMIHCDLTIRIGKDTANRKGWLPVLNYKNQAIVNPDAMQINTTRMRCLTKTLALYGLGLNIYAGEAFPSADDKQDGLPQTITDDQAILMAEAIMHSGTDADKFCNHYRIKDLRDLATEHYEQAMHMLNTKIAKNAATEQQ